MKINIYVRSFWKERIIICKQISEIWNLQFSLEVIWAADKVHWGLRPNWLIHDIFSAIYSNFTYCIQLFMIFFLSPSSFIRLFLSPSHSLLYVALHRTNQYSLSLLYSVLLLVAPIKITKTLNLKNKQLIEFNWRLKLFYYRQHTTKCSTELANPDDSNLCHRFQAFIIPSL